MFIAISDLKIKDKDKMVSNVAYCKTVSFVITIIFHCFKKQNQIFLSTYSIDHYLYNTNFTYNE